MALEQIRAFPHSAKVWQVSSQLNSVTWTERSLLVEALKISWNIWVSVVSRGESRELRDIWFEAMMILHNKATEECDHISCRLEKPTPGLTFLIVLIFYMIINPGLMRKIQRTVAGISY